MGSEAFSSGVKSLSREGPRSESARLDVQGAMKAELL